ncbi:MAG: hypothetical protein H8E57_09425, partial [Candidatus Cloacimonetes bacterium]|nr:hypothetical protein [Candidatus Cloacimonadota bacterium]
MLINKKARQKYKLEKYFFDGSGNLLLPNIQILRKIVQAIHSKRDIIHNPSKTAKAGELNGILLIDKVFHLVIKKYRQEKSDQVFMEAHKFLSENLPDFGLQKIFEDFPAIFNIPGIPNEKILIEYAINFLLNQNPAFSKYKELFDNSVLLENPVYPKIMESLIEFFENKPFYGTEDLNLIKLLQKPMKESPNSIQGQLEYIKTHWSSLLGDELFGLLKGLDLLKEEQKFGLPGPGPSSVYEFGTEEEYEKFTQDKDWMPNLVLIAKNTFVWLDQLSKKYGKNVSRLDEIPDEELQLLSQRGFTGLWLIGLWERSPASQKIKHISGNSDAISSAYSIKNYSVAWNLGGDEALENLKRKARKFNVRIGCDMVPNHTGIDSDWINEHPDWFIQLDYSPFPAYSFFGEDLSDHPEIVVQIEDHYYDKTDAAVVFKLYDKRNNQTRYVYHGNDGTSFPWNDTAQLNYLLPEVREAVIEQIIKIAKKFPIIRFDAAMTLAKKHFQRLWFPQPGTGGDIPTRAEFGLSKQEFDKVFPIEFWRDVVDRVNEEVPHTLLLAEAFWMMEGFFVRTLGMHRVYNSAFMNMLKNEENSKYRKSIFNVLEFNPEILKRFVNFMSNPDEETAIAQFGKDDKYFGICILMATMPGLPMFAHGQIEGFSEKYGMEYSRAKWSETEDKKMVQRHEREIFPLLKKRHLFAEVRNFLLYDFQNDSGHSNENVFAYSNENNGEKAIVVYNNKFEHAAGSIKWSSTAENGNWIRKNIGEAFRLHHDDNYYLIFRNSIDGLEYIRNSREIYEKGLFQDLGAFKYNVYLDFYEVEDDLEKRFHKLAVYLQGGGVPDIWTALKKVSLLSVLEPFAKIFSPENIRKINTLRKIRSKEYEIFLFEYFKPNLLKFIQSLNDYTGNKGNTEDLVSKILLDLDLLLNDKIKYEIMDFEKEEFYDYLVICWLLLHKLGKLTADKNPEITSSIWLEELLLGDEIKKSIRDLIAV